MPDPQMTSDPRPLPSPERLQELLHDVARAGRDDVLPALLQAGADIEAHGVRGFTPLILASYNGRAATTALLLDLGAHPDTPDRARGNTALMGVAFKGYADIARLLLDAGADPNRQNHAGQTALMNAVMFGHVAIVEMLLAAGGDLEPTDAVGNSAASIAAAQANGAMTDLITRARRDAKDSMHAVDGEAGTSDCPSAISA